VAKRAGAQKRTLFDKLEPTPSFGICTTAGDRGGGDAIVSANTSSLSGSKSYPT